MHLTAAHFEGLAAERRIRFAVETPEHLPARVDPEKVQRVLLNLLSNAFKFVSDGGRVRCELRVEGDRALLTVEDNGPGVRPELREAIFERFRQGNGASSKGGLGLGLAIVKELVTMHHGTIEASSDGASKGARFTVRLPVAGRIILTGPELTR